jgi:hypothetical protein
MGTGYPRFVQGNQLPALSGQLWFCAPNLVARSIRWRWRPGGCFCSGDSKFIALPVQSHWKKINTLNELKQHYPGVMDILLTWLLNYKGTDMVKILSENDEKHARIQ